MFDDNVRTFVEIGAGSVLQGLCKRIIKPAEVKICGFDKLDDFNSYNT